MTERDIQIGLLAHAIRVGKCPPSGMIVSCNVSIDSLETDTGQVVEGDKMPYQFQVTDDLLMAAWEAIGSLRAVYREPKTTVMRPGSESQEGQSCP